MNKKKDSIKQNAMIKIEVKPAVLRESFFSSENSSRNDRSGKKRMIPMITANSNKYSA